MNLHFSAGSHQKRLVEPLASTTSGGHPNFYSTTIYNPKQLDPKLSGTKGISTYLKKQLDSNVLLIANGNQSSTSNNLYTSCDSISLSPSHAGSSPGKNNKLDLADYST